MCVVLSVQLDDYGLTVTDLYHWSCAPGYQRPSPGSVHSLGTFQTPLEKKRQLGEMFYNCLSKYLVQVLRTCIMFFPTSAVNSMASWPPTPAVTSRTRSLRSASSSGINISRTWLEELEVKISTYKYIFSDFFYLNLQQLSKKWNISTFWLRSSISCKKPSLSSSASCRKAGSSSLKKDQNN